MEKLSIILVIIGCTVLVFAYWSFKLTRKHIQKFNRSLLQGLSDEKYFELKARQDYIIASSAIIFAVLSFIGYASINEIKSDLDNQFVTQKKSLDSLYHAEKLKMDTLRNYATETNTTFTGLQIAGKDLKDSMRSALNLINVLKGRVAEIFQKEIIRQNLFIIDNLHIKDFPISKYKGEDYRYVAFKNLTTISGQKVPAFSESPSIIVFTTAGGQVMVTDITKEGFKIFAMMGLLTTEEDIKNSKFDDSNLTFTVWISQKELINKP